MRGRKRISMAGVCCYRPDASDTRLAFHLREGAYDTDQLIPIVAALRRLLGGQAPVVLVWDNLPAHTSLAMAAWVADQHAWLTVEYLPAYAPDLNPVEGLWANLKGVDWPTVPAGRWRSWPARPSGASGGCGASPSCCSPSSTRPGFPYKCHPILRGSVTTLVQHYPA
jgi:DDE superfamily endonuclease